mgnify:CR=1 FL=1
MLTNITETAQRLGLRRNGTQYEGACLLCGGTDRFHIKQGHSQILLHCRNGCDFKDLAQAVGLEQERPLLPRRAEVVAEMPTPNARAVELWGLTTAAQPNHPYLVRKRIKPHGIGVVGTEFEHAPGNVRGRGNLLVVPSYRRGQLTTLQFIGEDGTKGFLPGAPQAGVNFTFAGGDSVWIVEGFATGASLHEDTGDTVVVAFSAGQLGNVAKWAVRAFPRRPVRVMADDDDAGHKAAKATGLDWRVPDFSGLDRAPGDNDYNDYVRLRDG